jgi:peroxiredoxin
MYFSAKSELAGWNLYNLRLKEENNEKMDSTGVDGLWFSGHGGIMSKRITVIIDPDGRVAYVFDQVQGARHNEEVVAMLKNLKIKK